MKHHCPMCGEQWNEDACASCGWYEGKQPRYSERAMDAVADTVLAYRPTARSKSAVQRKRRKTILDKKRGAKKGRK